MTTLIDIVRTPKRAHPNTNKVETFAITDKINLNELILKLTQTQENLLTLGYDICNVNFVVQESSWHSCDLIYCHIIGSRLETQEECEKRIKGQERSNARKIKELKDNFLWKAKRREFNRLTEGLSLEQLQNLKSL